MDLPVPGEARAVLGNETLPCFGLTCFYSTERPCRPPVFRTGGSGCCDSTRIWKKAPLVTSVGLGAR